MGLGNYKAYRFVRCSPTIGELANMPRKLLRVLRVAGLLLGRTERAARAAELQLCAQSR